jgi:hypothetical protein
MTITSTRTLVEPPPVAEGTRAARLLGLAALAVLALSAAFALYRLVPPPAVAADAPPDVFSSGRAMRHLRVIARAPHPVGSPEHDAVGAYLLKELAALGLEPEVQETTAVRRRPPLPFHAATVRNIVARARGTEGGRAVLLVSHYDSVIKAPGAGDDGAAVAAMLETARALKAAPPLRNDVIFLFTDAEEPGLLGAKAFVDEHPLAKEVGLVLNFDARGSSGPVVMYETGDGNGRVIREFAAAPHPLANSLSYDFYRLLPNDTDMTVFKQAGMNGLNFAFIDGYSNYHTPLDGVEALDERTLQHEGLYALSLTRHFGGISLRDLRENNATYFDVLGLFLIRYPATWNVPLAAFVTLLFFAVIALGIRKGSLRPLQIILGWLAFLLTAVTVFGVVTLAWMLIRATHSGYRVLPATYTYNSKLYLLGFAAVTVAITAAAYALWLRRVDALNLFAGALLWWLLLLWLSVAFLPGGSYLMTWPLFFYLLGLGGSILFRGGAPRSSSYRAVLPLFFIPSFVLVLPLAYLMFVGLGLPFLGLVMLALTLILGPLTTQLYRRARYPRWLWPAGALLLGLGFILAGSLTSGFDQSRPRPNVVFYGLNADTGKAFWISTDRQPDEWTRQFFSGDVIARQVTEFLPSAQTPFLTAKAEPLQLAPPRLAVTSDRAHDNIRETSIRITSARQSPLLLISVAPSVGVLEVSVNGKRVERDTQAGEAADGFELRYYGVPPAGIELTLKTEPARRIELRAVDQSYGLPDLPFTARPKDMMAGLFFYSDTTLVSKNFTF